MVIRKSDVEGSDKGEKRKNRNRTEGRRGRPGPLIFVCWCMVQDCAVSCFSFLSKALPPPSLKPFFLFFYFDMGSKVCTSMRAPHDSLRKKETNKKKLKGRKSKKSNDAPCQFSLSSHRSPHLTFFALFSSPFNLRSSGPKRRFATSETNKIVNLDLLIKTTDLVTPYLFLSP